MQETRGGVETYYIPDPLGSLVECRNSSGTKTYSAEYWPYGELQTSTGTNPSSLGYVGLLGYLTDSATVLYVRARYLMTKTARWLTVDPIWPRQPAYNYADNQPATWVDDSGNWCVERDIYWGRRNRSHIWMKTCVEFVPPCFLCTKYEGRLFVAAEDFNTVWGAGAAVCVAICKVNPLCLAICALLDAGLVVWMSQCQKSFPGRGNDSCIAWHTPCLPPGINPPPIMGCCDGFK